MEKGVGNKLTIISLVFLVFCWVIICDAVLHSGEPNRKHIDKEARYSFNLPQGWESVPLGRDEEKLFRHKYQMRGIGNPNILIAHQKPTSVDLRTIADITFKSFVRDGANWGFTYQEPVIDDARSIVTIHGNLSSGSTFFSRFLAENPKLKVDRTMLGVRSASVICPGKEALVIINYYDGEKVFERNKTNLEVIVKSFNFEDGAGYESIKLGQEIPMAITDTLKKITPWGLTVAIYSAFLFFRDKKKKPQEPSSQIIDK